MKKILFVIMLSGLLLNSCLPASLQSNTANPAPLSDSDLEATAGVLAQQTLQALPTATITPSKTPVVISASNTITRTASIAPSSISGTGTALSSTIIITASVTGSLPFTPTKSATPNPGNITSTETLHPQHYGTMPPYLPFGQVTFVNRSKAEVYVSLQCTTKEGYTTIIESPVNGTTKLKAPAGKYVLVVWVGGKKIVANFSLDKNGDLKIKVFKDHLEFG